MTTVGVGGVVTGGIGGDAVGRHGCGSVRRSCRRVSDCSHGSRRPGRTGGKGRRRPTRAGDECRGRTLWVAGFPGVSLTHTPDGVELRGLLTP